MKNQSPIPDSISPNQDNPMTTTTQTTTLTPKQLERATCKLRFDAHWMRAGAEVSAMQFKYCGNDSSQKRKMRARDARREFKQAAALYAQAAITCQAWIDADNSKGVRWFYRFLPAAFSARSESCAAAAKEVFAASKLIK